MKKAEFFKAKAVWARGRAQEMNLELMFEARVPKVENAQIAIATSGIYRLRVNGEFRAAGPARAAHGFFRVDEYELAGCLREGENSVVVEVLGYCVNSYDTLNQSSFLTAEIRSMGRVLAYTGGGGFQIYDLRQRVRKVQRYSFQRAFIDVYRLKAERRSLNRPESCESAEQWKSFAEQEELRPEVCYLAREVRYPQFEVLSAEAIIREGDAGFDAPGSQIIPEQQYFQVGSQLLGFPYQEEEEHISEEAQRIVFLTRTSSESPVVPRRLEHGFVLYRFPYNATGFFRIVVRAETKSRIFVQFDECLTGGDIDFLRMYSCNCFVYELEPGRYQLMSFAPYCMKYLKVTAKGVCTVEQVELVEYKHPKTTYTVCLPQTDTQLGTIYRAAVESFRANALDLFMDCPSRERGGWLCDSYFTSEVEHVLTGENVLERAFLENFILNDSFAHLPEGMLPMCYPGDHDNGNFIPNWAMWFVLELEKYVERTGDQDLAQQAEKAVLRLVSYFRRYENEYGLLEDLEGWIFIEWSRANDEELVKGVNFPTNMLYARMLYAVGKLYQDAESLQSAERLRRTIRKRARRGDFFTDHEQRGREGWVNTGECTEVCQYYAFFTGIADKREDGKLWRILVEEFGPGRRKHNRYPEIAFTNAFIGNYLRVELLFESARYEEVLADIKAYFLSMAEETGTLWEHEKPSGSCNHGFASYVICWLAGIYGVAPEH